MAESASDGLHTSQSGVIREDYESSSPREDAAEAGRCSSSGELADSRQQPTGAEGRGLDGGWEDASAEAGVGATARNGFADGNNPLADSDGNGTESGQPQHGTGGRAEYGIEELGNATTEGSQISGRDRTTLGQSTTESQPQRPGVLQLPTWPPSPSDRDGWERVLRERPDLAPAITKEAESQFRGVDNGCSHRVDKPNRVQRLRALGNGIVPTVAAEFLRTTRL